MKYNTGQRISLGERPTQSNTQNLVDDLGMKCLESSKKCEVGYAQSLEVSKALGQELEARGNQSAR